MLRITTEVVCDSCASTIEIDPELRWEFDLHLSESRNVSADIVLIDVCRLLTYAGWDVDVEKNKYRCPDCTECEVCSGFGYTWQQDPAGREDSEPLQAQCESCYGTGSRAKEVK